MQRPRIELDPYRLSVALSAIAGEYYMLAFDRAVVRLYGNRAPFPRLSLDHRRRVDGLRFLCRKYRVSVPTNQTPLLDISEDWKRVHLDYVELLQKNSKVYDTLLADPLENKEVLRVLRALRNETVKTHIPLFAVPPSGRGSQAGSLLSAEQERVRSHPDPRKHQIEK
ncbi:MAG: hypothetical protein QM758_04135 [Armatimonas sp.]